MKNKPSLSLTILLFFFSSCHFDENKLPNSSGQFSKVYGGTRTDYSNSMVLCRDGGYIMVGSTNSHDGDVIRSGKYGGNEEAWLVKLDSNCNIEWQKILGRINYASSIVATLDNGYIIAGRTDRNDAYTSGKYGNTDAWVVKLDSSGRILWERVLGGSSYDAATSITTTSDGGYVMAGSTGSHNGDVIASSNYKSIMAWIVKLDSSGSITWQKTFGAGSNNNGAAASIKITSDGGYIMAGNTFTDNNSGFVSDNHGVQDAWVVKLDNSGNIVWQKILGGSSSDYANSITTTSDDGYLMAGYTSSNDGDVSGNHGLQDAWIVKLNGSGNIMWQKTLGGLRSDYANFIAKSGVGSYIMAGYTIIEDGILTGNGDNDAWVVKLDGSGNIIWQKTLGGSNDDQARVIIEGSNSSYVMAGFTNSNNGDISGNHGDYDAWVVKFKKQ